MKLALRAVKILILAGVVLVIADIAVVVGMAHYRPNFSHADNAIVLGAAIYTPALKNRTLTALDLYEQGKADKLILSGGRISDSDISEAQYMEKVIKQNQDANAKYVLEDGSHNTYENIHNSQKLMGENDSVVIVSDEFHLARAVLVAKRAGIEKVYWESPEPTYYTKRELNFYYFRELVAMIAYIPKFIFN
jgi:uncharacterized SAM-binding protein YcdF (DUF218 family)